MSKCRDNRKLSLCRSFVRRFTDVGMLNPPPQRVAGGIDKIKVLLLH